MARSRPPEGLQVLRRRIATSSRRNHSTLSTPAVEDGLAPGQTTPLVPGGGVEIHMEASWSLAFGPDFLPGSGGSSKTQTLPGLPSPVTPLPPPPSPSWACLLVSSHNPPPPSLGFLLLALQDSALRSYWSTITPIKTGPAECGSCSGLGGVDPNGSL